MCCVVHVFFMTVSEEIPEQSVSALQALGQRGCCPCIGFAGSVTVVDSSF